MHQANPFDTEIGRKNSSYLAFRDDKLIRAMDGSADVSELARFVHGQFRSMVLDQRFSCLGARAAFNGGTYRFGMYEAMGSREATAGLAYDLHAFVNEQMTFGSNFTTFVACFSDPTSTNEAQFETLVWDQLQRLNELDVFPWDPEVSPDPENPTFSFSFAGRGFFIVGLHPGSSRFIRRFAWPTLVFNAHYQFEVLRETGRFDAFRKAIRARDQKLQGSINPNLTDFGEASEALQYSGRPVDSSWRCPFHRKTDDENQNPSV